MKTILITGGIGSGKSEVCRRLSRIGWPVYDSDSRTKALYDSVPGLRARAEAAIGRPLREAGVIFSDPALRSALEAVVYPEVLRDFQTWRARHADSPVCVFESAIALEKRQFDGLFDEVWLVLAPLEMRLERNPRVRERLGAQQEVPASRADRVIVNDRSLRTLQRRTDAVVAQFFRDNPKENV